MKKLKEQWLKFYHNTVVFYFVIGIIICGLLTLMFTLNTKNEVPLEEDTKKAEEVIKKDIEKTNEEVKDKLNDTYPTVEEISMLYTSLSNSDLSNYDILVSEFGEEKAKNINYFSSVGLLVSVNDSEEMKAMKLGQMKEYISGEVRISPYKLFSAESSVVRIYSDTYVKQDTSPKEFSKDVKYTVVVAEELINEEDKSEIYLTVYAHTTKDMTLDDLVDSISTVNIKMGENKFIPYYDYFLSKVFPNMEKNLNAISLPIDLLQNYNVDELNKLFKDYYVNAGTVLPLVYKVEYSPNNQSKIIINSDSLGDMELDYKEDEYTIRLQP